MESITEDKRSKPTVRLTTGISMKELLSDEGAIFEIKYDDDFIEDENCELDDNSLQYTNFACLGLEDEDTYNDNEPFEHLAKKMTNLISNGKVKKRILRQGVGNGLPEKGFVICDYNAYIEYSPTPFDSTYTRKRPFKFRLDNGQTLPGLEIAVKSMKISEKSQFLIHPDLAYGKMGCLSRVPPDTQVLFEVDIKNCLDTGATISYQHLEENEQQEFSNIYKYAEALCLKGNDFFKRNLFKQAIKEYNTAVSKLESCTLGDYKDQEEQQLLLLRLYSNLVVGYTKIQVPRKACSNANAVFHLVKGTSLKVPAKVYFNNARALMMLGDFDNAKQKLQIAKRMEPHDIVISEEFVKLDKMMKENHDREVKLAKAFFKSDEKNKETTNVTQEFKETLRDYFNELIEDQNHTQYNLPDDLNERELSYVRTNAPQFNLIFGEKDGKYFVFKEISNQD